MTFDIYWTDVPCRFCKENVVGKMYLHAKEGSGLSLLPDGASAHYDCYHRALIRDEIEKNNKEYIEMLRKDETAPDTHI